MGRYFLSDTMRGLISVSLLVASAVAAPQWDGLKSLVKNLSGDDKPGEVNGDYEQVPYQVVAKYNGYEERKYPSVMYACTEMTYDTTLSLLLIPFSFIVVGPSFGHGPR